MDDEIEPQVCKFPRIGNNRNNSINKISSMRGCEKEEDGKNTNHLQIQTSNWHHSSRIVRVSRASGGKDRHSKVMTSKGLRDRRIRLSVTTAIQFYDLQDRLGYDQPSKAVEWLIKAASDSISELPSLNTTFPDTPKQHNQSQNLYLSKSGCSSTSETSKGSGLSLSRSEIRVKARERARKRASKEKEKENESSIIVQPQQNHVNHNASFTELLTGGIGIQLGGHSHSLPVSPFSGENQSDEMQQQHHFAFMHENLNHSSSSCSQISESEYNNLNFRISSGLVGYNRGTLQSNSPSLLPQLQRFDGSSTSNNHLPFFIGSSSASTMDNHHHHHHLQFSPGFDGRLQLCYGDGNSLSDQKEKANKN